MIKVSSTLATATKLLLLGGLVSLQGCSREIDARQAHVEQGLIYKKDASDPFTGTLTNVDITQVGKRYITQYGTWEGNCTVPVKDGLFDGVAKCKNAKGNQVGEFAYSNGKIEGQVKVWAGASGNLALSTTVKDGVDDGVEERYNPKSGKIISRITYRAGQKAGEEKRWDITGETLLIDLVWENGRKTGVSRSGAYEEHYVAGIPDGTWKTCELSPAVTGEKRNAYFTKAQLYPAMAQQLGGAYSNTTMVEGPADLVCKEKVYRNGVEQAETASAVDSSAPDSACFDAKVAAFHKEHGNDAPIMNDVIQEWEAECKK